MPRLHPNLYFHVSQDDFRDAVNNLELEIPSLSHDQMIVELMRLLALISSGGRDGHTHLSLDNAGFRVCPLQFYLFSDGAFVVAATEQYREAIGQRLTGVGGFDVADVLRLLDPLIPRDNDWTVKSRLPLLLVIPEVMQALGIIADARRPELTLRDAHGEVSTLTAQPADGRSGFRQGVSPGRLPERPDTMYLGNLANEFWLRFLEESNSLYIQYNNVRRQTRSGETMPQFSSRVEEEIRSRGPNRVIVDVRHNPGGDNTTYAPLIDVLRRNQSINQPDGLFLITGRATFSAAGNFVTEMERATNVTLVGEPTGGSPNQYGDTVSVILPNSGLEARVASIYWQKSAPDDMRLTHEPDIAVDLASGDYFGGRDPALDAILSGAD